MNFFRVFTLLIICSSLKSCSKHYSIGIPILFFHRNHLVYLLNDKNILITYDISAGKIIRSDTLKDVTFPLTLYIDTSEVNQQVILFQNGGIDYKIISPNGNSNYTNKSFSHLSGVLEFRDDMLINTVSGLYICSKKYLRVKRKINCASASSTCDINISISSGRMILSESSNLRDKTTITLLDSNYISESTFIIDGIIKSKVYSTDNLETLVYIKEEQGNLFLIVINRKDGSEKKRVLLQGFQSGSDIMFNNTFSYYDGAFLTSFDLDSNSQRWSIPYKDFLNISGTKQNICFQSSRGIDMIDHYGKIIYSTNTISDFEPIVFENYLVTFNSDSGIVRTKFF